MCKEGKILREVSINMEGRKILREVSISVEGRKILREESIIMEGRKIFREVSISMEGRKILREVSSNMEGRKISRDENIKIGCQTVKKITMRVSYRLPWRTPAPHPVKPARPHPPEHPVNLAPMEGRRGKGNGGKRGGEWEGGTAQQLPWGRGKRQLLVAGIGR